LEEQNELFEITAARVSKLEEELARAEEANRRITALISNLSHEIRTPLNSIMSVVNLFEDTRLDLEQKKFVEMLSSSARDLLRLVEELFDLSRLEAGLFELKESPVPIRSCCSQAVRPLAMAAQERRLQVELKIPPSVPEFLLGDSSRLGQALRNVAGTAISLTARGKVVIDVEPQRETDEAMTLHFSIAHSAESNAMERIRAMLDGSSLDRGEFAQVYEGAGLGLVIAKGIAEAMGGSLWAEATGGDGNTFHLTVLLKKVAAGPETREAGAKAASGAVPPEELSILVVDDNSFNRSLTRSILKKKGGAGWSVSLAAGGEEALEKIAGERFDLVFMDIQMPGMSGLDATRAIRDGERAGGGHLPIVAMTAYAMEGDRQICLDAGMDDYIAKPVDPDELLSVIKRNASRRG